MFSSPQYAGALLASQSGTLSTSPVGPGIAAISSALVGTLTVANSSGGSTVVAATSVGVVALPASGGAYITSWSLSNAADLGKVVLAFQVPNAYV